VSFAVERGLEMRFIEHMPLDGGHTWRAQAEVRKREQAGHRVAERFAC
jgi:cyclic pyranopterin phosphate synthase